MRKMTAALAAVFSLVLAAEAAAQRGPGGGGPGRGPGGFGDGDGFGPMRTIYWFPSIETVVNAANRPQPQPGAGGEERPWERFFRPGGNAAGKRYIFVYVRPVSEAREPAEFNNGDLITASHAEWAFVKMDFDREHPYQKAWGVSRPPACVTLDIHGNEFLKTSYLTIESLRGLIRNTPDAIMRFEAKLKTDFQRAIDALKSDETRGVKALIEIAALNKVGYKEISDAQTALAETAEASFKNCDLVESVGLDQAIAYLDDLARLYKGTGPSLRAEVRIARLEHLKDSVQAAIQRLLKVLKNDPRIMAREMDEANAMMAQISRTGEEKIAAALTGNRAEARNSLRQIARDYSGTEAGRRATEEARKLD